MSFALKQWLRIKSRTVSSVEELVDGNPESEDERVMRPYTTHGHKCCVLCKAEGRRYDTHYIRDCDFLPPADKRHLNTKPTIRFQQDTHDASDCESDEFDVDGNSSDEFNDDDYPYDEFNDDDNPYDELKYDDYPYDELQYDDYPYDFNSDDNTSDELNDDDNSSASSYSCPTVFLHGDHTEFDLLEDIPDTAPTLQPSYESLQQNSKPVFPVDKSLHVKNSTKEPVHVQQNEDMCEVRSAISSVKVQPTDTPSHSSRHQDLHSNRYDPSVYTFHCVQRDINPAVNEISFDSGNLQYADKNPVTEHANQDLGQDQLDVSPENGPVSSASTSIATSLLNSRQGSHVLPIYEDCTNCDQMLKAELKSGCDRPSTSQHERCAENRLPSARCLHKARAKTATNVNLIELDLPYLVFDRGR
jgi:hypothetical protein